MNVDVDVLAFPAPEALPLEIVERNGIGHSYAICGALAETFSRGLSRFYLERFGSVLHHNVDKALLCGGAAGLRRRRTLGTHRDSPRRTSDRRGRRSEGPGGGDRHRKQSPLASGTSVPSGPRARRAHESATSPANDTSFGVGYAPLDELERVVLAVERRLNAPETKQAHPAIGEDIKVMGARRRP